MASCHPAARAKRGIPLVALLALLACQDKQPTGPQGRLDRAHLVGDAAAAFGSDDRFTLPESVTTPHGELSVDDATIVARKYVSDVAPWMEAAWSRAVGARVSAAELATCDRPVYARSAYESISGGASEITLRTVGSHWVVAFCNGSGVVQLMVSFSARAIDVLDAITTGRVPPYNTTDFRSYGVPSSVARIALLTPENAAEAVYRAVGTRISHVPVAVMSPRPLSAVLLKWRVEIERPVTVRTTRTQTQARTATLFAGFAESFLDSGVLLATSAGESVVIWTDPQTGAQLRLTLSPTAPAGVEVITGGAP